MAREMIYSGRMIGAEEALRVGLCNAVVERRELMNRVLEIAALIAAVGPGAVASAKQVINEGTDRPLHAAIELEAAAFAKCFEDNEQQEGMQAFLEKRAAKFEDR
jgi:enoyl-CoA hydratase